MPFVNITLDEAAVINTYFVTWIDPRFGKVVIEKFPSLKEKISGKKIRSCLSFLIIAQIRSSAKFTEMLVLKI